MKICPVTGRVHRTAKELAQELARIDSQISIMRDIIKGYESITFSDSYAGDAIGDAWNAAHDALDALERLRLDVEMNPKPLRESDRETYLLVKENRD